MDQERQNPEPTIQEVIQQERIDNDVLTLIGRLFTFGSAIFFVIGAVIGVITAIKDLNISVEEAATGVTPSTT